MLEAEHSTIGPIGTIIAQAIEGAGQDPAALFAEAGLDLDALRDPHVRMPADALQSLLLLAQERLNDPIFGLRLANYVHPTSFYSLGIAMCFSETLEDFLDRYVKYYRLITTNDALETSVEDDFYSLKATPREGMPLIPIRVDGFASLTVSTIRVALGSDFKPQSVSLARPRPLGVENKYEELFGCPVIFDTAVTALVISRDDLARKLPAANPELTKMYEQLTVDHLAKIDRADFPARVHKELIKLLPTGVSGKDLVAQALNMSTRTLYNKLESSGTTYREVLDDTRRDLAEGYIRQDLPIYEIAYLIGFSDTANFSRAFKKWTGKSPIEFREVESPNAG
ncbi:MAG: AraC family transcriptional regulator [Halioglobus sp.]